MVSIVGKRRRNLLFVLVLSAIVVAGWWLSHSREPRYAGQNLSSYLVELDLGVPGRPDRSADAARAVRAMGTNCFPSLLKMLGTQEPIWQRAAMAFNARQSWLRLPVTPADLTRARAIEGYAVLANQASPSVPALIELLQSSAPPQVRASVATALGRIGFTAREALPALEQAANDSDVTVRNNARFAIVNIRMGTRDPLSFRRF
jgi:hypothetical protein